MSCNIAITIRVKRLKTSKMKVLQKKLMNVVYLFWCANFKSDVQFYLPWPETLDNPEKQFFQIIKVFRIKLTKNELNYLLINSNVLLPPAAKRVKLINFSGPKQSFGQQDSADCKQRSSGTNPVCKLWSIFPRCSVRYKTRSIRIAKSR